MKKERKLTYILGYLLLTLPLLSFTLHGNEVTIIDGEHYSEVFGEMRHYRIFLPPGYKDNKNRRYPVIYFYHGWSQRYFGSTSTPHSDEGDANNGDNIANYVASHDVIVVRPDGYNRRPDEPYDLRPYNIGPVETFRQFPLYFPEIVGFIDSRYRTIPDRNHRAISGLSMGGFMTWWIAGKYPDMVCAAGNFCGSVEFVAGPYDFPAEYRHIDMYGNYKGVNMRLNYGDQDFIRDYHHDVNQIWTRVMDNYRYKVYHANHSTCGLSEMFDFILNSFKNPPSRPTEWNHIDIYPDFMVWDYSVSSDRHYPGFTVLENVSSRGFRSSVREFLPDGSLMPFVKLTVTTAGLYEHNKTYAVNDINVTKNIARQYTVDSDDQGRLKLILNGDLHEIGINADNDGPEIVLSGIHVTNMPWLVAGKEVHLETGLLNKGNIKSEKLRAILQPANGDVEMLDDELIYNGINVNETGLPDGPFSFIIRNDSAVVEQFHVVISDGRGREWSRTFNLTIRPNVPEFSDVAIADGRRFTVAAAGIDTVSEILGHGNGDGIANPGESVVVLVRDHGIYHRTEALTNDPFINPSDVNIRETDSWSNYDHVGATEKYTMPLISSTTPEGYEISFTATYWLPDYPYHDEKHGIVTIKVQGTDHTAPVLRRAEIGGDNTIHAWFYDGGQIKQVKARLIPADDSGERLDVQLNDDGHDGDQVAGDNRYSLTITPKKFGLYYLETEAEDVSGNKSDRRCPGVFSIH